LKTLGVINQCFNIQHVFGLLGLIFQNTIQINAQIVYRTDDFPFQESTWNPSRAIKKKVLTVIPAINHNKGERK